MRVCRHGVVFGLFGGGLASLDATQSALELDFFHIMKWYLGNAAAQRPSGHPQRQELTKNVTPPRRRRSKEAYSIITATDVWDEANPSQRYRSPCATTHS